MTTSLNLYATKVFSEQPIALWALDDTTDYVALVSPENQNLSNWDVSGATITDASTEVGTNKLEYSTEPFPGIRVNGIIEEEYDAIGEITFYSPETFQPADLSAELGSVAFGTYLFAYETGISVTLGMQYKDPTSENPLDFIPVERTQRIEPVVNERLWSFVSHTFSLPENFEDLSFYIKVEYDLAETPYKFIIHGINIGQWAEEFHIESVGAHPAALPVDIPLVSNGVPALPYGLEGANGYYVSNNNVLYAKNSGLPLVYGAFNSTVILPNTDAPSLIIPGYGVMNQSGQYKNYTVEFWAKIQCNTFEQRRIFGPLTSTDGLYVEGAFLKLKIGNKLGSHYVGEWDRPMLINIRITESLARLVINGEQVFSFELDPLEISFPDKISALGKDQDWLGFYAYPDVPIIQLDCVGIYPYEVPSIVSKRRFVYGQGVEQPDNIKGLNSTNNVFIDFPFSKTTKTYSYPKVGQWSNGIIENIVPNVKSFSLPEYTLPTITFNNKTTQQWYTDIEAEQGDSVVENTAEYVSTAVATDNTNGAVFDRSLTVHGLKIVVAGAVGGQLAVQTVWAEKVGKVVQLLTNPTDAKINLTHQKRLIATLKGDPGTYRAGYPAAQRVAYGGGDSYDPNFLSDAGALEYAGYVDFLNTHALNDMVWYKNTSGPDPSTSDRDIEEIIEHLFHTIHNFGVQGAVPGSENGVVMDPDRKVELDSSFDWTQTEIHLAMKEAITAGKFDPSGYSTTYDTDPGAAAVAYKEYTYLLNWGMWSMSQFWEGGSLSPEWSDDMRTPAGIASNNPLGHALFVKYFQPVLSKPNFTTLQSIFQDNDAGASQYTPSSLGFGGSNQGVSDYFIKLKPNSSWDSTEGYMFFENFNLLTSETKAFYGIFDLEEITEDQQILFDFLNDTTGNRFSIILNGSDIEYKLTYKNVNGTSSEEIIYSYTGHVIGGKFLVGLHIPRFIEFYGQKVASFFGTKQKIKMFVGGNTSFTNTYKGRFSKIAFCTARNLDKIKDYFTSRGVPTDFENVFDFYSPRVDNDGWNVYFINELSLTGDSTVPGYPDAILPPLSSWSEVFDGGDPYDFPVIDKETHNASYTLVPRLNFGEYILDIGVDSYWEDYLPLSYFGGYVPDSKNEKMFALDFLQLNIDYPKFNVFSDGNFDTANSPIKTYVSFQYLAAGANTSYSAFSTPVPLPKNGVVSPGTSWLNKKYEVVDDTIIYPPKGVDFNKLSINMHVELNVDGIISNPFNIKSLRISSQALGPSPKRIGTRFGSDIIPYRKTGKSFDYKDVSPFSIYKGSTPYLYNTSNSGIRIRDYYTSYGNRGLSMPINKNVSSFFKLSALQIAIKYDETIFSSSAVQIFELEYADDIIKFYLVADSDSANRGRIFALSQTTGSLKSGISYYLNGRVVRSPIIYSGSWLMLGIAFDDPISFSNFAGAFRVTNPLLFNSFSYYQTTEADEAAQYSFRKWFAVRSEPDNPLDWEYWKTLEGSFPDPEDPTQMLPYRWSEVLFLTETNPVVLDPAKIYKQYAGTDRVVIESGSVFRLSNYQYSTYNQLKWNRQTLDSA